MGKIYFTSDTHFCHNKDFCYEPRGFKTIEEMNEKIFNNWNSIVTDEDDVYHLGDVMLNDDIQGMMYLENLKGKIHIIRGNHDTDTRVERYKQLDNVVEITYATMIKYKKAYFYLSHYPALTGQIKEEGAWFQTLISLCGHCHYQDKFADMDKGLIYHVELDAHNCYPVSIDQIIEDIKMYRQEHKGDLTK